MIRLIAFVLVGLQITAAQAQSSTPELSAALEALRKGDCDQLASIVNEGLASNASLQLVAGVMHEEGLCVTRDIVKATRYYDAAEAAKDWQSSLRIGLSYALGDSLEKSYSKAGAWLAKSLEQQDKPLASQKLSVATIPGAETTPLTEWNGYLISVYYLGSRMIRYPREALRLGAEGEYLVKVCLKDGVVSARPENISPGPAAGVARYTGSRELLQTIEATYNQAIRALPPPEVPAPNAGCFQNKLTFQVQRR